MAAAFNRRPSMPLRLGHPSRMLPETRQVTMLILGHLLIFLTAMSHDEIVAEMVAQGWIVGTIAEPVELLVGLVLFLCWSGLTLRLMSLVRDAAKSGAAEDTGDDLQNGVDR